MLGGVLTAGAGGGLAIASAPAPAVASPGDSGHGDSGHGDSGHGDSGHGGPPDRSPFPGSASVAVAPDKRAQIGLWVGAQGAAWAASYDGQTVVPASAAGLRLADGHELGPGAMVRGVTHRQHRGTWTPVYGRNATVSDDYDEVRLALTDSHTGVRFSIVVRAYDAGVALRYELETSPVTLDLAAELTTFVLPDGCVVYGSRDEDPYLATPPAAIPSSGTSTTDTGRLFDNPVTVVSPQRVLACVCEAARDHYPRLMLAGGSGSSLAVHLMQFAGRAGSGPAVGTVSVTAPFSTPWRVLVLASTPAELVDHGDLVPTLAEPNAIGDTSWIRPGKAIRVTTLTTQGGLDCVDFAAAHGLSYVEFDAGWYGPENAGSSDPTVPIAGLDLAQVIAYGNGRHVGVVLYVNRIALADADTLFGVYQSWGVAGLKLGFILDGTQAQTDQITGFAQAAARHHLLVNQHDDLRPFGQERTYPNWINMEGVRGNEHFPTATHNVTLPFTRNVAGPMDYTICLAQSRDLTTNVHQLAMAAVYYSPLEWLYWYDAPSRYATGTWPELPWFDAIPTVWDESHAVDGQIGQYVVVARRSGTTWYLGAMTNEQGRVVDVPLAFLGHGTFQATIYADGVGAAAPNATPVVVSTAAVTSSTTLSMLLAPSGGQAVVLAPS
jgi:alpha-glucosidase